ncbi:MAG TPA: PKD domain-containing protein [Lysobacter sp.]
MHRSARSIGLLLALMAAPAFAAGVAPASVTTPLKPAATKSAVAKPLVDFARNKARATCRKAAPKTDQQGRVKVGTEVAFNAQSTDYPATRAGMNLAWRQEIGHPGASYIAAHFKHFNLPRGAAVVVRSPDSSRMWTYTGQGKARMGDRQGFWAIHIPGEKALIEVYSRNPIGKGAVQIDGYARGFSKAESGGQPIGEPEAICGQDDSDWAQCYVGTDFYDKGRAVARLLINGTSGCTGWLVGSEGHLMTNNHCITSAGDAGNTDYEFMAEGSCSQNCASFGACPGTVAATSATFVQTDAALDYTLVKLPTNVSTTYGYLQMRSSGAVLNERIYIPQHAAAWGKRIAVESSASGDGGFCKVSGLNQTPCSGGPGDTGYMCDTQGGSSGSPVIGFVDNAVVSLHHCANCPNRGVPIQAVIADLGGNVPANGTVGGGGNNPPTANFNSSNSGLSVTFTNTSSDSDGSIASSSWNFGDGGTSTATSPTHNYASSGTYNVTLTVTDNLGATGSVTKPVSVSGTCGLPDASCSVNSDCCSNRCKGKTGNRTCR